MKRILLLATVAVLLVNTSQAQNVTRQAGDWIVRGGVGGADWNLNENWLINLDARYISVETDAQVNGIELGKVDITPWVVSLNLGYKF